ncbi:MAG: ribose 5-phosphate isomerase [Gaiellales bacterium]|jgi:ribose 5-phosphate isomerase A|nr:ribose 5-phosphate isomerase [Gaiellales bacterium]
MSVDDLASLKREAAEAAIDGEVRSGMTLGLGTGSTADFVLEGLAARLADGRLSGIVGVPTSEQTAARASELGIPLVTLDERPALDVAIDGADEIAPGLALIKGLGGAHLREKVVARAAARFVVVGDDAKLVDRLGSRAPLPVEVVRFARAVCEHLLGGLGWTSTLRLRQGAPWVTDEGNQVLDCRRDDWSDPATLDRDVKMIPGVVEHGLFLGIAQIAYVASPGGVKTYEP